MSSYPKLRIKPTGPLIPMLLQHRFITVITVITHYLLTGIIIQLPNARELIWVKFTVKF